MATERGAKGGLTKRASLNALAAVIEYGARLVVGFVVNPILVARLGGFAFGGLFRRLLLFLGLHAGHQAAEPSCFLLVSGLAAGDVGH